MIQSKTARLFQRIARFQVTPQNTLGKRKILNTRTWMRFDKGLYFSGWSCVAKSNEFSVNSHRRFFATSSNDDNNNEDDNDDKTTKSGELNDKQTSEPGKRNNIIIITIMKLYFTITE